MGSARRIALAAAALIGCAGPAAAGPPYLSDDPEPTDLHHWEIYAFATAAHVPGETDGQSGLDINYGGFRDVQITLVVPSDYADAHGAATALGNIEIAAKYRFVHQSPGSWLPDVAFFPRMFTPTAGSGFGTRRVALLLPVWAEKDFGRWSLFGGGGYQINRDRGARSGLVEGVALSRQATARLSLGGEIFHHARDEKTGFAYTGINAGITYRLSPHWSLLGSAGPGLEHARSGGRWNSYVSVKADY